MPDKPMNQQFGTLSETEALRRRIKELEADLAEFRQFRQQFEEDYAFRKVVIERAAEGICVCHAIAEHPYVRFTLWNSQMEQITGYTMDQINHAGWYQTMYPDPELQEQARQRMMKMRDGDDLWYERWEITRADGQKRMLGISTSIISTHDDQVHVLALMQDVTDEERHRRQLETRVATLEGLLPICTSCKKIRDDKDGWHAVEVYITEHSDAEFTHSICPACKKELYPNFK